MKTTSSCLLSLLIALVSTTSFAQQQSVRLELIPPSPVTNKVVLDIRGAVENDSNADQQYSLSLYLDQESPSALLHSKKVKVRETRATRRRQQRKHRAGKK